jgi:hypothetical protein
MPNPRVAQAILQARLRRKAGQSARRPSGEKSEENYRRPESGPTDYRGLPYSPEQPATPPAATPTPTPGDEPQSAAQATPAPATLSKKRTKFVSFSLSEQELALLRAGWKDTEPDRSFSSFVRRALFARLGQDVPPR